MTLARKLGLGRFVYKYIHRPIADWNSNEGRMKRAAAGLRSPRLPFLSEKWPACRYLTGRDFWYQTAFCARSLEIACGTGLRFEFFDDGTLEERHTARLKAIFPRSRIISAAAAEQSVEKMLPASEFPRLRAARRAHPLMRKLVDLHATDSKAFLCLDSDMLFFEPAPELCAWLRAPAENVYLRDVVESYVMDRVDLEKSAGVAIQPLINTGLIAYHEKNVDWEHLEWFVGRLPPPLQTHRLLEQTLTAVHFARTGCRQLPADRYRVLIHPVESPPPATLLHYCWNSNPDYRRHEWIRFLKGPYHASMRTGRSMAN